MSFILADLFVPTPALPGAAAGGIMPAPGQGEGAGFAEALKTFRSQAYEGADVTPASPVQAPQPGAQPQPLPALMASLLAALPPEAISELGLDPEILQRLQAGTATAQDMEALTFALARLDAKAAPAAGAAPAPETGETGVPAVADEDTVAVAGTIPPPAAAPSAIPAEGEGDSVEMALKIADARPAYVPPPSKPGIAPKQNETAAAPVLREGRASTAGAPPILMTAESAPKAADVPQVSRAVLEVLAPRASGPLTNTMTPPAAAPQNIPQAAQALAATPHVTSIQLETVPAAPPPQAMAAQTSSTAEAVPVPATPAPAPVPAANTPVMPANTPAIEMTIAGGTEVEENAADPALAVLTKDKSEARPAPAPVKTSESADTPEFAAPKSANTEPQAKPAEAKPEPRTAEKSASGEKPAGPEPRAPQTQTQPLIPAGERIALADTALRAVQQTAQQLPAAAIPQIAGEMAARFRQGQTRFEIRLDPPELGRVDVRIEVDSDGRVHSRLMVEKSETLDLLKADQRALERALHEAGFKSEQNTLSFSLRDERGGQNAKYEQHRFLNEMNVRTEPEDDPARLAAELAYRAPMRGAGGVDLRV